MYSSPYRRLAPLMIGVFAFASYAQLPPDNEPNNAIFQSLILQDAPPSEEQLRPGELLDNIVAAPGPWEQMCGAFVFMQRLIPMFGYERQSLRYISAENFQRLRAQRDAVVLEIRERLIDLAPGESANLRTGVERLAAAVENGPLATLDKLHAELGEYEVLNADSTLDQYLVMLLDLNGVEALPGLVKLEAALDNTALYRNALLWKALQEEEVPSSWQWTANNIVQTHARVLSVITALLRSEHFEPLSTSGLYAKYTADYADLMTMQGRNQDAFSPSEESVAWPPEKTHLVNELVHFRDQDPARRHGKFSVPYGPEARKEIADLAARFLEEVNTDDYQAEKAMLSPPRRR